MEAASVIISEAGRCDERQNAVLLLSVPTPLSAELPAWGSTAQAGPAPQPRPERLVGMLCRC